MRRGDRAEITMRKILHKEMNLDDAVYLCEFLKYDDKEACLYLLTHSTDLTVFSLDAIYFCEIQTATELVQCTGRIKERCCQEEGRILKIEIENGFYKINIKSVDK